MASSIVTAEDMQLFLDERAEIHFMPPAAADGRAAAALYLNPSSAVSIS